MRSSALIANDDRPAIILDREVADLEHQAHRLELELASVHLKLRAARRRYADEHGICLRRRDGAGK